MTPVINIDRLIKRRPPDHVGPCMYHFGQSFQNRVKVSLGTFGPLEYRKSLEIKAQTNPSFIARGWHPVGVDRSLP
ncbi:hypothetical protein OKW50_008037 [Paraburkholderia youngii]